MSYAESAPHGDEIVHDMTVPRLQLAAEAVRSRRWEAAAVLADQARSEHALAHDGLRDVNARLLDAIHRRYEPSFANAFCSQVYEDTTIWYVAKMPEPASFREAVEAVAMLWHWHMTTFRLTEDRDKATYILEPCGSGGRLINEGAYYRSGKRSLSLIASASTATFNEPNFPSYCTHCADHNRTFLERGFNIMVFEGWTRAHRYGVCLSHVFKRLDDLPEEFYSRIGLDPSQIPGTDYEPEYAERVFSDEQLQTLATHPLDRFQDAVALRDAAQALALVDASWGAWMGLHGAYRVWFTAFCNRMRTQLDRANVAELIDECAWWLVAHALTAASSAVASEVPNVWSRFWRSHGEPVDLEQTNLSWTWKIPSAALIDPELARTWTSDDMAEVCNAITRGAASDASSRPFGKLTAQGEFLVHNLTLDPSA